MKQTQEWNEQIQELIELDQRLMEHPNSTEQAQDSIEHIQKVMTLNQHSAHSLAIHSLQFHGLFSRYLPSTHSNSKTTLTSNKLPHVTLSLLFLASEVLSDKQMLLARPRSTPSFAISLFKLDNVSVINFKSDDITKNCKAHHFPPTEKNRKTVILKALT